MELNTTRPPDATTTPPTAGRGDAYALITSAISAGLPIPEQISLYDFRQLVVRFDDNDRAAVLEWTVYLSLRAPACDGVHVREDGSRWSVYRTATNRHPGLPGWLVDVACRVDVPADEVAAVTR